MGAGNRIFEGDVFSVMQLFLSFAPMSPAESLRLVIAESLGIFTPCLYPTLQGSFMFCFFEGCRRVWCRIKWK